MWNFLRMNEIKFNKKIYNESAVKISMADFSELASFSFKKDKKYLIVNIKNIHRDFVESIKNEFVNYVLAKTIQT
jgi:hypothetical protein